MTVCIQWTDHVKKDLYAVTALTKTEHAEAAGNACHCVMIMSNITVLNFLSHLMYVTDAKIEISAVWKKDFIGQRRQITGTGKHYPCQEQVLT